MLVLYQGNKNWSTNQNWNCQTAISGQLQSVSLPLATSWERSGGSHLCRWSGGRFPHKYNIIQCSCKLTLNFYLKFYKSNSSLQRILETGRTMMETSMTSLPSPEECRWPFYNFKSIVFIHPLKVLPEEVCVFSHFILNMFSFIHAVILLGEVQEGGEGCRKSQRTKDVSFDCNSKVKFWNKLSNIFLTNIKDLIITIITWYFVNQEPSISKMSSLSKVENTRYKKK